ncbi:MAG: phage tail tape measure protein [Prevotella sp.]|nr:phage tail tape measure protein [Prevotella sp.]
MADTRVKIIDIQVRYEQAIAGIAKYRAAIADAIAFQKELKQQLKDGSLSQEEYDRNLSASQVYIKQQGDALRVLSNQVSNQIKAQQQMEGSVKSLKAQLASAKESYESLGKAERESAKGQELATKIKGLTEQIKQASQVEKLQEGSVKSLRAELNRTKAEYEGLSKAERESARGKDLQTKIAGLETQLKSATKSVIDQEGSLKQLRAQLSEATREYDAMGRAERNSAKGIELKQKINGITDELKKAEAKTQRFYRNVGNYQDAAKGLDTLKAKATDLGKAIVTAVAGGSMLAFSKDVLQVTRDFEDAMARVKAVTNASAEDMRVMTEEARKMGRETIYHATDAAQAMENLSRGGFNAQEATLALSKTLQLAQANAISLNEASDIMIRTMRGFKMPVTEEEMVHANDVLSKVSASSATNIIEIAEALKNAAPFGTALNQSIEEVNAALGVLADVGVRGADAGTALRMVILGLSTSTAKQQKVFKEFGIDINQTSLETEGLTRTLQRLKESGIMEAEDSANKLADVFGRRCTPQVMALVGNIDRLDEKLVTLGGKWKTFDEATALSESMDVPLNQVNASLNILEKNSITGLEAQNALKTAMARLSSEAKNGGGAFKQYGIEFTESSMKVEGLIGTLKRLKDGGILETENGTKALADVFGTIAAPAIQTMIANVEDLRTAYVDLENADVAGTTARMFEQSYSDVSKAIFTLSSAWESFKISLGQSNSDLLLTPLKALTSLVHFLEENLAGTLRLVISLIASISFLKLVNHAKVSFAEIRASAVTNAEQATATKKALDKEYKALQQTNARDLKALQKASGAEEVQLRARTLDQKRRLDEIEKQRTKAALAETQAWHKAAAMNSGSAWQRGMAVAKTAVQGFVTASKTMLRSFALTAAITLAIDGLMSLISWIKKAATEGEKLSATQLAINDANKKASESCADEISKLRQLYDATQDVTLSEDKRREAAEKLQKLYPDVFDGLTTEAILAGEAAGKYNDLADAIVRAAKAEAYKQKITDITKEIIDQQQIIDDNTKWMDEHQAEYDAASEQDRLRRTSNPRNAVTTSGSFAPQIVHESMGAAANADPILGQYNKKSRERELAEDLVTEKNKTITYLEGEINKMNNPTGGSGSGTGGGGSDGTPELTYTQDVQAHLKAWQDAKDEYHRIIKDQSATTQQVLDARKKMNDALSDYNTLIGQGKGGSGGGGRGGNGKTTAQKQAELEAKALEEAEKAMLDLMKDTAAKRRQQLEQQYDGEIRKLKVKLATEKNLTETARSAIERTILAKEQKKNEELAKLDDKEWERQVQDQQKLIQSRLSVAMKGSRQELELKKEQNEQKAELDLIALQRERENRVADAEEKKRIADAAAQQQYDAAVAQYGAESDAAALAQANLLQIQQKGSEAILAVKEEYAERENNVLEASRRQNLILEQQYQQQLASERQQALMNQITELEMWETQRILSEQQNGEDWVEQQMGLEQLRLDVVNDSELAILAVRQQAAAQKYEDIVRQGQLEGETEQQFNTRRLNAEKDKYAAMAAFRNADLKNRKAYFTAVRSVTNSLVSLANALADNNEAMVRLSEIITLAQISIDTGRALSAGIASAASLPYPANLAAIATTVATVLANIATAISTVKQANSQIDSIRSEKSEGSKYATGGKVTGPGTGTSDSIPAMLSNGEYVMTARATKLYEPLLAAMNEVGKGVVPMQASYAYRDYTMPTEELQRVYTEAAQEIRPVVSVVEIADAQRKVDVIESLDNL